MTRVAGPLTEADLATLRGMRAAMAAGGEAIGRALHRFLDQHDDVVALMRTALLKKRAALAVAFDALPRHRELPEAADTCAWLDRHISAATPAEIELYQALRGHARPAALLPSPVPFTVSRYSTNRAAMIRAAIMRARAAADGRRRVGVTLPGERLDRAGADGGYRYSDAFTWTGGA